MQNREVTWRWHNFLTGFGLIAAAVVNGLEAVRMLYLKLVEGAQLSVLPIIACILSVIFALNIRAELMEKKKDGADGLIILYGINIVLGIIMLLGGDAFYIPGAVGGAVMIALNKVYYEKRANYLT